MSADDEVKSQGMTAMIDVTFLLLIFFMVATKFRTEEGSLKSHLPKDEGQFAAPARVELKKLRLVLRQEGPSSVLTINQRSFPSLEREDRSQHPDYGLLEEELRARVAAFHEDGEPDGLPVILDAGRTVPVSEVVALLDTCLEAGVKNVTYAMPEKD